MGAMLLALLGLESDGAELSDEESSEFESSDEESLVSWLAVELEFAESLPDKPSPDEPLHAVNIMRAVSKKSKRIYQKPRLSTITLGL